MTAVVVLDWGVEQLAAALIVDGEVIDSAASGDGLRHVVSGGHAAALENLLAPWQRAHNPLTVIAAGMIGSRTGWIEMPYVAVPAYPDAIAASVRSERLGEAKVLFVPGLTDPSAIPYPDVMRGEELVLLGVGLDSPATVILPGTHSKWARVGGGWIQTFRTFVTGEVRNLFLSHSSLAKVARPASTRDWAAFADALELMRDEPAGLLERLFAARTGWLAGRIAPSALPDYVAGLTLGAEFAEARVRGWHQRGDSVVVAGDADLEDTYLRAAAAFGLEARAAPADVAIRGALTLAQSLKLDELVS